MPRDHRSTGKGGHCRRTIVRPLSPSSGLPTVRPMRADRAGPTRHEETAGRREGLPRTSSTTPQRTSAGAVGNPPYRYVHVGRVPGSVRRTDGAAPGARGVPQRRLLPGRRRLAIDLPLCGSDVGILRSSADRRDRFIGELSAPRSRCASWVCVASSCRASSSSGRGCSRTP